MKRILIGLLVALLLPALAFSQAKAGASGPQKLTLEFVDGSELTVTAADKTVLKLGSGILEGDAIPAGATVQTGATTFAELKLSPNGSIIKLGKSTSFTVSALAAAPQDKNAFAVLAGKVRTVAAKGAQYQFSSQTAVAGVRGTDFAFDVEEGTKALLSVAKGQVDFSQLDAAGNVVATIPVAQGMAADAFAPAFAAFKFSADQFAQEFGDLGFKKLAETDVPQAEAEKPATAEKPASGEQQGAEGKKAAEPESAFVKWLRESMGFEIGSVTINGIGYSKAVLAPDLSFGKLKLGLYLPVIYTSDIFSPNSWYHPDGNNEWSFGGEYWGKDNVKGIKDFGKDLALKIKYVEYGRQLDDPFFIKAGNLEGLTIGHGLVMRNYTNNTEFPSVRRVGLNLGLDGGAAGFEALVNDLADPSIYGGRFYLRPIPDFKLAFGFSGVLDTAPGKDLEAGAATVGNMWLVGGGLDLDLPIIERNAVFGIRAFADMAATAPYVRQAFSGVSTGLKTDLVYSGGKLQNWGAASGFIGNVLFIDWRLEFRYFKGAFRPSFFDSTYDRKRGQYAQEYAGYLVNPASLASAPPIMGIYGEGGFNLLKNKLVFTLGYMYPWSADGSSIRDQFGQKPDEFHARLVVRKGLIPILDLSGSIGYDRRNMAQAISDGTFRLLDANSSFGGEVVMPVPNAPNLDLAVLFQTVPVRVDGLVQYDSSGAMEIKPSISIEMRLHF